MLITLPELSIADIVTLMTNISGQMSRKVEKIKFLEKQGNADTLNEIVELDRECNILAFRRLCLATELERRIEQIDFPKPKKSKRNGNTDSTSTGSS